MGVGRVMMSIIPIPALTPIHILALIDGIFFSTFCSLNMFFGSAVGFRLFATFPILVVRSENTEENRSRKINVEGATEIYSINYWIYLSIAYNTY